MSVSKEIFQCYLWIDTGEEHPDTITKQTRIKPSKIYIKGDKGNSRFSIKMFGNCILLNISIVAIV